MTKLFWCTPHLWKSDSYHHSCIKST